MLKREELTAEVEKLKAEMKLQQAALAHKEHAKDNEIINLRKANAALQESDPESVEVV